MVLWTWLGWSDSGKSKNSDIARILRTQPARNFRCDYHIDKDLDKVKWKKVIRRCSKNKKLKKIKVGKVIGKGTYGIVYQGMLYIPYQAKIDMRKYSVKKKKRLIREGKRTVTKYRKQPIAFKVQMATSEEDLSNMYDEVEYMYYMGDTGLGPEVYDAFFMTGQRTGMIKRFYYQIVIMEYFDMNVAQALSDPRLRHRWEDIIEQMIDLLRVQWMEYNLHCIDIKPGNYVYNKKENIVKLIDFGKDFCYLNSLDEMGGSKLGKEDYFGIVLLQLFMMVLYAIEYRKDYAPYLRPFYEQEEFMRVANNPNVIKKVLRSKNILGLSFSHYVTDKNKPENTVSNMISYIDEYSK